MKRLLLCTILSLAWMHSAYPEDLTSTSTPIWKSVVELENRNGILYFDGCDVRQLAEEFGTPLYVYSQSRIQSNYRRLVKAYQSHYPNFQVYYAVKANNNPAIVKILAEEGAGARLETAKL